MKKIALAAYVLFIATSAKAGLIVGGSAIIDSSDVLQLEQWLGKGDLTLTNIFTKSTIDNSSRHFHNAADGKGPTFSIFKASNDNGRTWHTLGGYNPLSWRYGGILIKNEALDAFIFDLDERSKWNQLGPIQSYAHMGVGPAFGRNELGVDQNLEWGWARIDQYEGQRNAIMGGLGTSSFRIAALEVFALETRIPVRVPEPNSGALVMAGMLGFAAVFARRQRLKSAVS